MSENRNPIQKVWDWFTKGLDRTPILAFKLQAPQKALSPLAFLGMCTFIVFLLLGLSGALLLIYYQPTYAAAFDSVDLIENEVTYGFAVRQLHYHASNAMIFLALCHMYYQFFSGKFKLKNDVLWVTGILLGTITILEAYTGYDLIFSDRAVLAISIGASLNNAAPVLGPVIVKTMFGQGFSDIVIRFYALHVFIVPMAMVILMFIHFPRALVFDVPMIAGISGAILIVAGLFPIALGIKFDPSVPPGITVPEWYFSSLYAFLRTGVDKFISGILLPTIFIILFLIIPFVDKSKKFSWKDRPFFTALGITSIIQAAVTSVWGFYIPSAEIEPDLTARLFIPPVPFYGVMLAIVAISFVGTYGIIYYIKQNAAKSKLVAKPKPVEIKLSPKWIFTVLIGLLVFQIFLNVTSIQAFLAGLKNLALLESGVILVVFAVIFHIYRYGNKTIATPQKSATS